MLVQQTDISVTMLRHIDTGVPPLWLTLTTAVKRIRHRSLPGDTVLRSTLYQISYGRPMTGMYNYMSKVQILRSGRALNKMKAKF
jgi:hypothetical protein